MMSMGDPRRAALEALADLLGGHGYVVQVGEFHLVAADRAGIGARMVEVWCQARPDDGGRLWFSWAGGSMVRRADRPTDALVAVKAALRPGPDAMAAPLQAGMAIEVVDVSALTRNLESDLENAFPGWLIAREARGRWAATKPGWGVLYGESAVDLRERLRRYGRDEFG